MGQRRRMTGTVVSDKMDKTVVVAVPKLKRHRIYRKLMRITKRYQAHDEDNTAKVGDTVLIEESRPLPEVAPEEVDVELLGERTDEAKEEEAEL